MRSGVSTTTVPLFRSLDLQLGSIGWGNAPDPSVFSLLQNSIFGFTSRLNLKSSQIHIFCPFFRVLSKEFMQFSCSFQPCQIVCLEHQQTVLYAEIIQILATRSMLWLRPLMLAVGPVLNRPAFADELRELYDLRHGADLVWPQSLFRLALDTEVIPLLTQLQSLPPPEPGFSPIAHDRLRSFVQQVWQAHPEAFVKH
jgi:hypothetical protein